MPTGAEAFLWMPGVSGLWLCARTHLKKGLVSHSSEWWGGQQIPPMKSFWNKDKISFLNPLSVFSVHSIFHKFFPHIGIYKRDLVWNNLKGLICVKNQPNQYHQQIILDYLIINFFFFRKKEMKTRTYFKNISKIFLFAVIERLKSYLIAQVGI